MAVDPRIQRILDGPLTTPTDLRFKPLAGHASPPGTGPIGEFCRSCRHRSPTGNDYRTWFCNRVSWGRADRGMPIALDKEACGRWEPRG